MKNNTNEIKEKAIAIVDLFEQLLDSKEIDIPCSDEAEQSIRYKEGNCARIYGIEYCELIDGIMNIIYEPTNSAETTNGFKNILKEAGRFNSSVVILNKVITCLQDDSIPVDLFDNNSRVVEGKKCKEQASQIIKVITDEVIIGKDDLVGKLDDIYIYISYEADIMLHNYAINQSY